jgi:hypothetical protein
MPERDPQQMAQCVCRIPCECGRSYIGETGRHLAMQLCGQRHSLKEHSKLIVFYSHNYKMYIKKTQNNVPIYSNIHSSCLHEEFITDTII